MKKIPMQPAPSNEPVTQVSPRFLLEGVEVLLLGSVWSFLLIWAPFYQNSGDAIPDTVQALQWLVVSGLSVVLLFLLWFRPLDTSKRAIGVAILMLMALLSLVFRVLQQSPLLLPFHEMANVMLALLGLAYFVATRLKPE